MSSKRAVLALAIILCASLSACSEDPEKEANRLLVETSNLVLEASPADPLQKWKLLQEADQKVSKLTSRQYAATNAAVRVASGEKIGGKTIEEIRAALADAAATREVCGQLRTRQCAKSSAVKIANTAAKSPKTLILALSVGVDLQAAKLDEEATKVLDGAFETVSTSSVPWAEFVLKKLATRQTAVLTRDRDNGAVFEFIDHMVARVKPTDRADFRKDLLVESAGWIDAVADPDRAVNFVKVLRNENDRKAAADLFLRTGVKREGFDKQFESIFLPLYPLSSPPDVSEWVRWSNPQQHLQMMKLAKSQATKDRMASIYMNYLDSDWTTASLNQALSQIPAQDRWGYQGRFLGIALRRHNDLAERNHALAAAKEYVDSGNESQVVSQTASYELAKLISSPNFDPNQVVSWLQAHASDEGYWHHCKEATWDLERSEQKAAIPAIVRACLDILNARHANSSAFPATFVIRAFVGTGLDAGKPIYEKVKGLLKDKGFWYPASSEITGELLHQSKNEVAKAEYDDLCADPQATEDTHKNCRAQKIATSIKAGKPVSLRDWEEVTKGRIQTPGGVEHWDANQRAFFDTLIKDRPALVVKYLSRQTTSVAPYAAVIRLSPEEVRDLLPSVKGGPLREALIWSITENHGVDLDSTTRDAIWNAPNDFIFAERMGTLIAAGDPSRKAAEQ